MPDKPMRNRLAFAAPVLLLIIFCAVHALAQSPAVLPLADRLVDGRRIGYWIQVQAADGEPSMMLLDTGSTGFMIMADRLGKSGVQRTGKRMKHAFLDGTVFEGEIVRTRIRLGHTVLTEPISILAIDRLECAKDKLDCPGKNFLNKPLAGIMGVGMGNVTRLDNPLGMSNGFIISGGAPGRSSSLTLGLTPDNRAGFTLFPLPKWTATLNWRDAFFEYNSIRACIEIDAADLHHQCGKVLFDSGSALNLVHIQGLLKPGSLLPDGSLAPGTNIVVSPAGMPNITATSNAKPWSGRTKIVQSGDRRTILGAAFFQQLDIIYDLRNNAIGVRPAY